jgi:hypothetical protein
VNKPNFRLAVLARRLIIWNGSKTELEDERSRKKVEASDRKHLTIVLIKSPLNRAVPTFYQLGLRLIGSLIFIITRRLRFTLVAIHHVDGKAFRRLGKPD